MSETTEISIHVSPAGECWDVETDRTMLASAGTQEEALEIARAEAPDQKADAIVVHTSEGPVECEIPVLRDPLASEAGNGGEQFRARP
jgi:hypothetical protein